MNKTETEIREMIGQMCKAIGRKATADRLNVKPQYISMLLNPDNPRPISSYIADQLGYMRESATTVLFVPKNNSQNELTRET